LSLDKNPQRKTTKAFRISCIFTGFVFLSFIYLLVRRYWVDEILILFPVIGGLIAPSLAVIVLVSLIRNRKALSKSHVVIMILSVSLMVSLSVITFNCVNLSNPFGFAEEEPWPVSMRQGPDTHFAETKLQKHFSYINLSSISDVYYRDLNVKKDNDIKIRFHCDDVKIIDKIVDEMELVKNHSMVDRLYSVDNKLMWWPKENDVDEKNIDCYFNESEAHSEAIYLWCDRSNKDVYYYFNM